MGTVVCPWRCPGHRNECFLVVVLLPDPIETQALMQIVMKYLRKHQWERSSAHGVVPAISLGECIPTQFVFKGPVNVIY